MADERAGLLSGGGADAAAAGGKAVVVELTRARLLAAAVGVAVLVVAACATTWAVTVGTSGSNHFDASAAPPSASPATPPSPAPAPGPMPAFGEAMRREFFVIEEDINFLNHGSYGATTRPTLEAQARYMLQMEAEPCRFFSREVRPELRRTMEYFAPFVGARAADMVWIENASQGVNAVLRSLRVAAGDTILLLSVAYGMVEKTAQFLVDRRGVKIETVDVTLPVTPEGVVTAVETKLLELAARNETVALASFSHISSTPALVLPVKDLIQRCHQRGIPVMIDGAHALGQIPLNLTDLGADFYLANGHKWLNAPKGSAFLHTTPQNQPDTVPPVVSFGYDATPPNSYQRLFSWTGTRDLTPLLSMREATHFLFEELDINDVWTYQHDLCKYANDRLSALWGTAPMTTDDRLFAAMTNVALPPNPNGWTPGAIQSELLFSHKIESVIYEWGNATWTRVSCQIYNTQADIDSFGEALLQVLSQVPPAAALA